MRIKKEKQIRPILTLQLTTKIKRMLDKKENKSRYVRQVLRKALGIKEQEITLD